MQHPLGQPYLQTFVTGSLVTDGWCLNGSCDGLNRNIPHRLRCLSTRSPVGGAVCIGLGGCGFAGGSASLGGGWGSRALRLQKPQVYFQGQLSALCLWCEI